MDESGSMQSCEAATEIEVKQPTESSEVAAEEKVQQPTGSSEVAAEEKVQQPTGSSEVAAEEKVQQPTGSSEAASEVKDKQPTESSEATAEVKDKQPTESSEAAVEVLDKQLTESSEAAVEVKQPTENSEAAVEAIDKQPTESSEAEVEVKDKRPTESFVAAVEVKDKQPTESFEAVIEVIDKQLTESSEAAVEVKQPTGSSETSAQVKQPTESSETSVEVKQPTGSSETSAEVKQSIGSSETSAEVKQPTGSSKRKRKHSIKRNVPDNNSDCNDVPKLPKIEKTSGKRARKEKKKPRKDAKAADKTTTKTERNEASETSPPEEPKRKLLNLNDLLPGDNEDEKSTNFRSTEVANGDCSPIKLQCQNCKFCSEHIETREEPDDAKEKLVKDKQKFTCELCAKGGSSRVYNSVERYKHHMAVFHEIYSDEIKRFECTECPETVWFPSKSKYTYHLGTKHPGIMRFVCEYCTEVFILKANYKSHMKTHNIVVPKKFTCDVCTGTFVNKSGYEAHKRRFPGPHIKQRCSHCGFSFSKEKHMKNHRCKTLLLEEAAARANQATAAPQVQEVQDSPVTESSDVLKVPVVNVEVKNTAEASQIFVDKKIIEATLEMDSSSKKSSDGSEQSNKRVVLHRIIPRRNQDQQVYRPVQTEGQDVPESLVVQELREIDLENGTFIAATSNEPEQQYIVRDINGHLLQGNQILQLDINDVQQGEENQVYLADWNIVAPYVLREKSP